MKYPTSSAAQEFSELLMWGLNSSHPYQEREREREREREGEGERGIQSRFTKAVIISTKKVGESEVSYCMEGNSKGNRPIEPAQH